MLLAEQAVQSERRIGRDLEMIVFVWRRVKHVVRLRASQKSILAWLDLVHRRRLGLR